MVVYVFSVSLTTCHLVATSDGIRIQLVISAMITSIKTSIDALTKNDIFHFILSIDQKSLTILNLSSINSNKFLNF